MLNEYYVLNNGLKIPKIGLGTWLIDNDKVYDVIKTALDLGYRHIDTAQAYENEEGVGRAIKDSGIKREDIFITSKIKAEHKTFDEAYDSINKSLRTMGLEYLDLMIIHSPEPWAEFRGDKKYFIENVEVWKALEKAYREGKVKAIGLSNFLIEDIDNILKNAEIKPMVNQILTHISNTKSELIDYSKKNDILVEAYSPIAHGAALNNETIIQMANKYHVSVAQLCIRYILELGLVVLPKASSRAHLEQNADVDFEISKEDMDILLHLDTIEDYGEHDFFPVFSAKDQKDNK